MRPTRGCGTREPPGPSCQNAAHAARSALACGVLRRRALVIVSAFDDRARLLQVVRGVRRVAPRADVCIVDHASPDGTGLLAEDLARRDARVSVVHVRGVVDPRVTTCDALRAGLERGYDWLFELDATHDTARLPDLARALDEGAGAVVGVRSARGAVGGESGWRRVVSAGAALCARVWIDAAHGYRAYSRAALERLDLACIRSGSGPFAAALIGRARRVGVRVTEVPVFEGQPSIRELADRLCVALVPRVAFSAR